MGQGKNGQRKMIWFGLNARELEKMLYEFVDIEQMFQFDIRLSQF